MARKTPASLHIGISGWTYQGWRGVFYPKGLPQRRELEYAGRTFGTVEINGSFYSLQRPQSYQSWYEQTPPGCLFSVKGSRFITHLKKLRGVETALANFYASGVLLLREKLGPFLWQLPPQLAFHAERMEDFFTRLPRDTEAAARLASGHDARLAGRAAFTTEHAGPLLHCVEVRHPSFLVPEFFQMLRQQQVAFVFADTAGRWPYAEDLTADFVYVRLHGAEELYASGYGAPALDWWANRLQHWRESRQPEDAKLVLPEAKRGPCIAAVHVYFDNDAKVRAPFDAQELRKRMGGND